jgi:hypothetical protein
MMTLLLLYFPLSPIFSVFSTTDLQDLIIHMPIFHGLDSSSKNMKMNMKIKKWGHTIKDNSYFLLMGG